MEGGFPNHTFSIKKDRELSSLEVSVNSIKRRFSNSRTKDKWSSQESEGETNLLSRLFSKTSKCGKKDMEVDDDGDKDDIGSSLERVPIDKHNQNGIRSASGSGNPEGSHGREHSINGREGTGSQLKSNFDPFTQSVKVAIQQLSETQAVIQSVSDLYTKHVCDVETITQVQQRFNDLEKECEEKGEQIRKLNDGFMALADAGRDREEELKNAEKSLIMDMNKFEAEKKNFQKFKDNAEKRNKLQEAELWHKQEEELKTLKAKQEREFQQERKKLDQEKKRLENEYRKKVTVLDADMTKLSKELDMQKKANLESKGKLAKAEADYDDLSRLKDSFKEEAKDLKNILKTMENEFGLGRQGVEFYKEKFAEMSKRIEELSVRYFKDLNRNDFDFIHNELVKADGYFTSVPISSSADSELLRMAHAQRVISGFLWNIVWQPFSSEETLQQPGFMAKLRATSREVARSSSGASDGGRAEAIWAALTMRALQSLSATSTVSRDSTSQGTQTPGRVEVLVSSVINVLRSLISPAQEAQFSNDLVKLAHSAVLTWDCAQTDELQITVWPTLDPANINEWRSFVFDPPLPPFEDGKTTNTISSTHPRIFTLFPRVTAKKFLLATKAAASPPGSWQEPEQEPSAEETYIYPGLGLRDCSALVIRGKEEEEDRQVKEEQKKKHLKEIIEKEEKEWEARNNRSGVHSRRSMVTSVWELQSPMSDGRSKVDKE